MINAATNNTALRLYPNRGSRPESVSSGGAAFNFIGDGRATRSIRAGGGNMKSADKSHYISYKESKNIAKENAAAIRRSPDSAPHTPRRTISPR